MARPRSIRMPLMQHARRRVRFLRQTGAVDDRLPAAPVFAPEAKTTPDKKEH